MAERAVEPRDCPYMGLDYYQEKFGAWFFGRDTDGDKIITNLHAARLTLLHAESGVGKSSLLRAGVAWRLRQLALRQSPFRSVDDIPIVFSSWKDDPVLGLMNAIGDAIDPFLAARPRPELPRERLDAAIEAAAEVVGASLLIMLDQFEEYFLYCAGESTPERFADELACCINRADLPASFLIAIREDAYASLGDLFKGRIANVYGNYLHIEHLDRASAEKAIRAPLEVYNRLPGVAEPVEIQDELVEAVLKQVRAYDDSGMTIQGHAAPTNGSGRVATPLLQLVMETVWEHERTEGSRQLRLSTLQNLEGVEKIVDTHLGNALSALEKEERQTAIDMFDRLVSPSGGKIAESVPDLAKRTNHSEEQIGRVLDKLDHARIVRPVPAPPGQDAVRFRRYEIFHDVLAPAIDHAIAVHEEQRRERQVRLARRARRLRLFRIVAVGLLIVASMVGFAFAVLYNNANILNQAGKSRELAADASAVTVRDPELGVLLAMQALRQRLTSQAEDSLRAALPELQTVRTFPVGTTVNSAAFDPSDPNRVASADRYGIASIWDVRTGHRLMSMSPGGFDVTGGALALAFNPGGTEVAVGYADGQVALFDGRNGRKLRLARLAGSPAVNDVEFLGSTGQLAIATQKGLVLWQLQNPSSCCRLLSSISAYGIAADPRNPESLAATTVNGTVIWTISGSGKQRQFQIPEGSWTANDAAFSPDGGQVATADSDGKVRVYDRAARKTVMTLDAGDAVATRVAFSSDGSQIVAGYSSGMTRVWDTFTGLQLTQLTGNAARVEAVRFSPDSNKVVTASDDGTVRVWYSHPRELQAEFATSSANGVQNLPAGTQRSRSRELQAELSSPSGNGAANPALKVRYISPDRIAVLTGSGNLYVFTPGGARQAIIRPPSGTTAYAVAWDSAGTHIVTSYSDGTVDIWHAVYPDYTQLRLSLTIRVNGVAQDVAMSADGSRFMVVTSENYYEVQLRSTQTGQRLKTFDTANAVSTIAFSPSGRQILSGDYNGQLEVWDSATGHRRLLGAPGPSISDIESNKSGSEFVTASAGGTVTLWASRGYRPLISVEACSSSNTASPSPDGRQIVVACGDGKALVFGADTGLLLTILSAPSGGTVSSTGFSPDGKSIITAIDAGDTGYVEIWNSELASPSLATIERIAEQRVTRQLTPAERNTYLTGIQ